METQKFRIDDGIDKIIEVSKEEYIRKYMFSICLKHGYYPKHIGLT